MMLWLKIIGRHPVPLLAVGCLLGSWLKDCTSHAQAYTDNDMQRAVNNIDNSLRIIAENSGRCR